MLAAPLALLSTLLPLPSALLLLVPFLLASSSSSTMTPMPPGPH
uniref:Uncharacterized protein n=1 Tax=Rhizophora mucronata TaxID=61149 RepID=A0A2P2MYU1_RHIMU